MLLTIAEVAEKLGVSKQTAYSVVRRYPQLLHPTAGGVMKISETSLARIVEDQTARRRASIAA